MAVLSLDKNIVADFESNGFALIRNAVTDKQIDMLAQFIESYRDDSKSPLSAGFRNLLKEKLINEFANCKSIKEIVTAFSSESANPVRSIFFDKTPASNWYVTWHQDLSIAVEKQIDTPGFGPWSTKEGTLHVQPPAEILEQIISLRIHLDACPKENGAIKFIAGSHKQGLIDPHDVLQIVDANQPFICEAERGDIIIMRPLILHSSSKSTVPDHRRVLHLEYSSAKLPNGLSWTEA